MNHHLEQLHLDIPQLAPLPHIEMMHVPHLPYIDFPELDFQFHLDQTLNHSLQHMQHMHFDIPHIPSIHIPDFDFSWDWIENFEYDEELTADEQLKLESLAALMNSDNPDVFTKIAEFLKNENNPKMRFYTLTYLKRTDEKRAVPIYIDIAKNDTDMQVRKLAVRYLGESGDDRAFAVLQELIK